MNLALCRMSALTPGSVINILDETGVLFENRDRSAESLLLYPDFGGLLRDQDGRCDLETGAPALAGVFAGDEPLFYGHDLTLYVTDPNPAVRIVGPQDSNPPPEIKTAVVTRPAGVRDFYIATMYTNFEAGADYHYDAIYSGVSLEAGRQVIPERRERLAPQLFVQPVADPDELTGAEPLSYYVAPGQGFGNSRVYVSHGILEDTRAPKPFRYSIRLQVVDGGQTYVHHGPWRFATALAQGSLLPTEEPCYENGALRLDPRRMADILVPYLPVEWRDRPGATYRYSVVADSDAVTCYGRPDGQGSPYARIHGDTGTPPKALLTPGYRWSIHRRPQPDPAVILDLLADDQSIWSEALELAESGDRRRPDGSYNTADLYSAALTKSPLPIPLGPGQADLVWLRITVLDPQSPFDLSMHHGQVASFGADGHPRARLSDVLAGTVTLVASFAGPSTHFVPRYAVRFLDAKPIRLARPASAKPEENWYIRVRNGRFTRMAASPIGPKTFLYRLPGAEPDLAYTGFSDADGHRHLDLNPYTGHSFLNWDYPGDRGAQTSGAGLLSRTVYVYLRPVAELTRFVEVQGEPLDIDRAGMHENQRAWWFKLAHQPSLRHPVRIYTAQGQQDIPRGPVASTHWIPDPQSPRGIIVVNPDLPRDPGGSPSDRYVVDYSWLGVVPDLVPGTFRRDVLFHSFKPVNEPGAVLLGRIKVRLGVGPEDIGIVDARQWGGGIKEELLPLADAKEPETRYYWDIGHWDGEPWQRWGVGVIRIPRRVLKEFGGRLDRDYVERAVARLRPWGTLAFIEYVDREETFPEEE